jgi:hypothetical protein
MHLSQITCPLFLPSLYGDIRLTAQGNQTEIEWENLSPSEREAISTIGRKFNLDTASDVGKVVAPKSIDKIEPLISKAMKRGRKLLSAVVFKNGRVEEVSRVEKSEPTQPYRDPAAVEKSEPTQPYRDPAAIEKSEPKAAVTVAQPMLGCPIPEFERADVRATRVLREFLSGQQLADFERTQSFLVVGGDTGRQYVLTSRQASTDRLARVGGRSVFDVIDRRAICVHDWVVPAAEELLELKLFLELPGHEAYVRGLSEVH